MERQKCQPQHATASRVYTLCSFDRGWIVPKVHLIEAVTDDDAVACARGSNLRSRREVWDHRRLVAEIQPRKLSAGS